MDTAIAIMGIMVRKRRLFWRAFGYTNGIWAACIVAQTKEVKGANYEKFARVEKQSMEHAH